MLVIWAFRFKRYCSQLLSRVFSIKVWVDFNQVFTIIIANCQSFFLVCWHRFYTWFFFCFFRFRFIFFFYTFFHCLHVGWRLATRPWYISWPSDTSHLFTALNLVWLLFALFYACLCVWGAKLGTLYAFFGQPVISSWFFWKVDVFYLDVLGLNLNLLILSLVFSCLHFKRSSWTARL